MKKYLPRGIRHSTDMHTGTQSAKKDVISTKPQKGRASRGPEKKKRKKKKKEKEKKEKKASHPLLAR